MGSDDDIVLHYEDFYDEDTRLSKDGVGRLEMLRTRAILERHLPDPPAAVLDVGGGPGVYATQLNEAGYDVELIDIVPKHIRQATERGIRAQLGDARSLPVTTKSQDAVLLLGPLYHLQDRDDRLAALREAARVGTVGAPVFAAGISRYAPAIDGLDSGSFDDPAFAGLLERVTTTGLHDNPTGNPQYFTTSYFHLPEDLAAELTEAGLRDVEVLAIEGIGWVADDLSHRLDDAPSRQKLMDLLAKLESEPGILGASPHLLAVGFVGSG
jgi:ubiquinone/menaquinone biosynthesis C-methylase UbiE